MSDDTDDELRALIDQWTDMADAAGPVEFTIAYENCANQLKDALDDMSRQ